MKGHQRVVAQSASFLMEVFNEIVHLKFRQRRQNGLAVVVPGDGKDAQRRMRLLPIAQEWGQTIENELGMLDGRRRNAPVDVPGQRSPPKIKASARVRTAASPPRGKGQGYRASRSVDEMCQAVLL